jgi:hypothetical protein
MYEEPELFEVGEVDELTLGRRLGDFPDGVPNRFAFAPVMDEDQGETE